MRLSASSKGSTSHRAKIWLEVTIPLQKSERTVILRSLDERSIRDGLGESVKIALYQSEDFLEVLANVSHSDIDYLTQS